MTFPILFPQYAKSSMDSSTKILRKLKQFRELCKNRTLLVRFVIFQILFSKGTLTFVGPWRKCRVSWLTMVNGLPKNWIGTSPPLCSKTEDVANA